MTAGHAGKHRANLEWMQQGIQIKVVQNLKSHGQYIRPLTVTTLEFTLQEALCPNGYTALSN